MIKKIWLPREAPGWLGDWQIIVKPRYGKPENFSLKNRITNAGLDMIRDAWNGDLTDIELKYLALGDSDAALDDTMTTLDNELFRTTRTSAIAPATGQLQSTILVLDSEAVFHIKEIGIFAGAAADANPDTGIMVSRSLWSKDKTALESIQFVRTDTIARG